MVTINSCNYSPTNHAVQIGGVAGSLSNVSGLGNSGQVLTSQGASSDPAWADAGISTTIVTSPASSNTATTAFGAITAGVPIQNTLGYDVLISGNIDVTVAAGAAVTVGVGPTSTPTEDPITPTLGAATIVAFSAIVPSSYYLSISGTGTITISSITNIVTPL